MGSLYMIGNPSVRKNGDADIRLLVPAQNVAEPEFWISRRICEALRLSFFQSYRCVVILRGTKLIKDASAQQKSLGIAADENGHGCIPQMVSCKPELFTLGGRR